MVGGAEERSQLERRHLGKRWPIDVVGGDGSPLVQLEPRVDGRSGVGAECSDVVDRTDRRRRQRARLDGAGDRTQEFGRLHGGRRAAGEQPGDLVRTDPPRFAVREQIAHRHEIAAVRRQVPARRLLEVRKRARRMRSELGVVEFGELDGLQCEVPRHLRRPVPVEPVINLLAPPAFLPRERGGLGSPAKLRVQPASRTFITNTGGGAFGVEPARSPTPSGRT